MQVPGHPVAMQLQYGGSSQQSTKEPNTLCFMFPCFPPLFSLAYYIQQHVHQVPGMVCIASQPSLSV